MLRVNIVQERGFEPLCGPSPGGSKQHGIDLLCFSDEFDKVMHSDDAFAPVAYLNLRKMHLENKTVSWM